MKKSYIFLAEGFEEIEALTAIDLLRRANIPLQTVSITQTLQVTGTHGVTVTADSLLQDTTIDNPEWLILPGGMPGATNLYECYTLRKLLMRQASSHNGRIAAICAAPAIVLGQLGLLKDIDATCYPGFEQYCTGATMHDDPVVVCGRYVTGNGPANAMLWALKIISETCEAEKAGEVATGLLFCLPENISHEFSFG